MFKFRKIIAQGDVNGSEGSGDKWIVLMI